MSFPRLYAAASLKHSKTFSYLRYRAEFSAALCRGLIEALYTRIRNTLLPGGFPRLYAAASLKREYRVLIDVQGRSFPRLYAAASLKHPLLEAVERHGDDVFRGFMPRPH